MPWTRMLSFALLLSVGALPASAVTILAADSGWHSSAGSHASSNQNYAAGWSDNVEIRNFFVFDLSSLPGTQIASATLRAYNPANCEPDCSYTGGYASPDPSETYQLREVTTPAALVTADSIGLTLVYDDLGDGDVLGSYTAGSSDNGAFIEIALNASGLAALQGAVGSDFVLGGHVATLTKAFGVDEAVWADTDVQGVGPYTRELVIAFVPEPGTGTLLALGLALTAARRRRWGGRARRRSVFQAVVLCSFLASTAAGDASAATVVEVLSNRADLISGGDALVEIAPAPPPGTVVDLDGADVTAVFSVNGEGRYLGLVTGLAVGPNLLTATLPDGSGAAITIENHPQEGPLFGGPHLPFWDCTTESNELGPPLDPNCNVEPIVDYHYISSLVPQLGYQPYDPENPPADVALVTTIEGETVRHIVRRERGAMNRGLYAYAHLHDPALGEPDPSAPQAGWNGKVVFSFGGGGGAKYHQGAMPDVLDQAVLAEGFARAQNSLNVYGHHGNTVTSAECVMMLKERIIEQVGEIRFTIGTGGSGGAVQQNQIGNAYPGLLTGLIPSLAYSDSFSPAMEVADCISLESYWPTALIPFTPTQRWAVDGHQPPATSCTAFFGPALPGSTPFDGCFETPADPRDYNALTNPDGCRSKNPDIWINIFGRRRSDHFGKFIFDNIGVQYGLEALNLPLGDPGKITFAQFIDLNSRVVGQDNEGLPRLGRNRLDSDVDWIAFRTSHVVDGRGIARAPVLNLGAIENLEFHNPFHAHASEARMRAIGHGDNHVLWHAGPTQLDTLARHTMNEWLDGIETTGGIDPYSGIDPAAIGPHRPAIAEDSCWFNGSQEPLEACDGEVWGDARIAAGMPKTHDVYRCHLKPVDPADYAGAFPPLTPADIAQIRAVFPEGVCDYSAPSRGAAPSVQWLTFEGGPGGQPLGPPPISTPF